MKHLKRIFALSLMVVIITLFNHWWIGQQTNEKTFNTTENISKNKVGLVLGCAKYVNNGRINLYYKYRIDATVKLFKAGKIEYVLVSGDNSRKDYDEPTNFKTDLIARGIPESRIVLDYAGFRTLDSVLRAYSIFGQTSITVISQEFHNQRAIYIAESNNMKAVGFNAKDVYKSHFREYLARAKMRLDLLFNVQPKFYGEKIPIG